MGMDSVANGKNPPRAPNNPTHGKTHPWQAKNFVHPVLLGRPPVTQYWKGLEAEV